MPGVLLIGGARAGEWKDFADLGQILSFPPPLEDTDTPEGNPFAPVELAQYRVCPFVWHGERLFCGVPVEWGSPDTWNDTLRARIEDSVMAAVPIPEPDTHKWRL